MPVTHEDLNALSDLTMESFPWPTIAVYLEMHPLQREAVRELGQLHAHDIYPPEKKDSA